MSASELFAWPAALPILLLAPLAWLFFTALDRARLRRVSHLIGPRARILAPHPRPRELQLRRILASAGIFFALVATLQPLWGEGPARVEQRGVDCIVCLDVSQSMLARDVAPSRLQRARQEIQFLSERVRGDRLGLVVFAGEPTLAVPLTQDMRSYAALAELAGPSSVARGGTDLGAALETALAALESESGDHAAVFLLTDGEDLEQRGLRAAEKLAERGISVHCVGLGSTRGSKIPLEQGGPGEEFLRDRSGADVVSAMDPASLRRIAEAGGGAFLDAGTRERPLVELYERRVLPMARRSIETRERMERINRFQWPLLVAFALWMLELSAPPRAGERKRR